MPLYTDLPPEQEGHFGERRLAQQLLSFSDPKSHFWFGVQQIPGLKDIDILLYHEKAGIFCIEVKAVTLSGVKEFGYKTCLIENRHRDDGPHNQAFRARDALLRYLSSNHRFQGRKMGYIKSTACWPRIARETWKRKWDNPAINDLSERMLFAEDIESSLDVFIDRLVDISYAPPVGLGNDYAFVHNPAVLSNLKSALDERGKQIAAPSDLRKLHVIEEEISRQTLSEVPVSGSTRLVYTGYPGTGKTFRLLQVAVYHALKGKKVLYGCYNKTLAADVRRLLSYSDILKGAEPEVYDVFDLIRYYDKGNVFGEETTEKLNNARQYSEMDIWAELLVEDMKLRKLPIGVYDAVLIDEAQDMKDWAVEMLSCMHMRTQASVLQQVQGKSYTEKHRICLHHSEKIVVR